MDVNKARQSPFSIDGTCNFTDVEMNLIDGSSDADGVCKIKNAAFQCKNQEDNTKTTARQPIIAYTVKRVTSAFLTADLAFGLTTDVKN